MEICEAIMSITVSCERKYLSYENSVVLSVYCLSAASYKFVPLCHAYTYPCQLDMICMDVDHELRGL